MKIIFITCIVILASCSSLTKLNLSHPKELYYTGPIEKTIEFEHNMVDGELNETPSSYMTVEYEYNDKGEETKFISKSFSFSSGEELATYIIKSEYNDKGDIVRNTGLYYIVEYEYNDKGQLISRIYSESVDTLWRLPATMYKYEYNDKDDLIKITECNYETGEVISTNKYEYNDKREEIKQTIYYRHDLMEAGSYLTNDVVYEYNDTGDLIKKSRYTGRPDELYEIDIYEYNERREKTKYTAYRSYYTTLDSNIVTYEYNDKGYLITESVYVDHEDKQNLDMSEYSERREKIKFSKYDSNQILSHTITYEYNRRGGLVKELRTTASNDVFSYTKYDNRRNWVERFENRTLTKREITYR